MIRRMQPLHILWAQSPLQIMTAGKMVIPPSLELRWTFQGHRPLGQSLRALETRSGGGRQGHRYLALADPIPRTFKDRCQQTQFLLLAHLH